MAPSLRVGPIRYLVGERLRELAHYVRPIVSSLPEPTTRFVLFAHYRTGSTLLTSLLNQHPELRCDDELFLRFSRTSPEGPRAPRTLLSPQGYLEAAGRMAGHDVYGVNLKLYQLRGVLRGEPDSAPERFLQRLAGNGWKFVHLRRENALRLALSAHVADQRQRWHVRAGDERTPERIEVDVRAVLDGIANSEETGRAEDRLMADLDHVRVVYEADLRTPDRHQQVVDRIFDHLGVSAVEVEAGLQRVSSDDLREQIANYDELAGALERDGVDHYLSAD